MKRIHAYDYDINDNNTVKMNAKRMIRSTKMLVILYNQYLHRMDSNAMVDQKVLIQTNLDLYLHFRCVEELMLLAAEPLKSNKIIILFYV